MSITPARVTEATPKESFSFVTHSSPPGVRPFFPSYFGLSTQNLPCRPPQGSPEEGAVNLRFTPQHSLSQRAKQVV